MAGCRCGRRLARAGTAGGPSRVPSPSPAGAVGGPGDTETVQGKDAADASGVCRVLCREGGGERVELHSL